MKVLKDLKSWYYGCCVHDYNVRGVNMKVLGKGNTAEVLDQGNGKVCKLFYEGWPLIL